MADKLQDHLAYPPRGMDAERAAAYLGLGKTKFLEMVDDGRMPKPLRIEAGAAALGSARSRCGEDLKAQLSNPDPIARDRARFWQRRKERERSSPASKGTE